MTERYKEIMGIMYHLSDTFSDKGEAFAYAKKRLNESSSRNKKNIITICNPKETFVKIETIRKSGQFPLYEVWVRVMDAKKARMVTKK